MTRRYTLLFLAGIIAIGALVIMVLGVLLALVAPPHFQNTLVDTGVIILLVFMGILVIRYLLLLWLAYLQHMEANLKRPAAEDGAWLPPVSILVPAFNEGIVIQAAIRSLIRQDYPRFEVLVIDDGSTDDTYAQAAELEGHYGGATVRVVSKKNGGKAAALNCGIALARHPLVLCMDGDSKLAPSTLRTMVRHFTDPKIGAVAGNVKVINRLNFWTRMQALEYIQGLNMARRAQAFMRAVNIIPGPIGMFRRDMLTRLGGYDTDTFAEDADLTLKILAAGWRIEYEERAIAYTEAPEDLRSLLKQRYRWTRGILQALGKHHRSLFSRRSDAATRISLGMMVFESVIWPFMNVFGSLFFVLIAVFYGAGSYLVGWWLLLSLLDLAAALHTVAMEEEDLNLVPLAILYRFFFILLIDMTKLLSSIEEAFNLEMSWGKLERVGRI